MSSLIAFVRALVMLACVLVVLVLVISHGDTVSRAKEAATRCLNRLSADGEAGPVTRSTAADSRHTRLAGASPREEPSKPAGPRSDGPPGPLPEPVDEVAAAPRFKTALAGPSSSAKLERVKPAALHAPQPAAPQAVQEASASSVADWQERASVLQQLGAVEYAMEKWGDAGQLYRFRCEVAVGGSGSYRKHFQAVDADGGRAVERVLQRVGAWRRRLSGAN